MCPQIRVMRTVIISFSVLGFQWNGWCYRCPSSSFRAKYLIACMKSPGLRDILTTICANHGGNRRVHRDVLSHQKSLNPNQRIGKLSRWISAGCMRAVRIFLLFGAKDWQLESLRASRLPEVMRSRVVGSTMPMIDF